MATEPLECGWCGSRAHMAEGRFMGCCSAGFCENEGYTSVEEWNAATRMALREKARYLRQQAASHIEDAENIEARLVGMGAAL